MKCHRKFKEISLKASIYIHSLWLFFALAIVNTFNPNFISENYTCYVDWKLALRLNIVPLSCIIFLAWGEFYQYLFEYGQGGAHSKARKILKILNITHESSFAYLTSNIIPLLSLGSSGIREVGLTVLIVFVTGVIFVKTDMYYLNPTLTLAGYRVYKVLREDDPQEITVLSSNKLQENDLLKVRGISDNIYTGRKI